MKFGKIKSSVIHDYIININALNKQDVNTKILLNHDWSRNERLHFEGSSEIPWLSKKLLRAFIVLCSQISSYSEQTLKNFQLQHKQFWRIIFWLRNIKNIRIVNCSLYGINKINSGFWIDVFTPTQINLFSWSFMFEDGIMSESDCQKSVIQTWSDLQKMQSSVKNTLFILLYNTKTSKEVLCDLDISNSWENATKVML